MQVWSELRCEAGTRTERSSTPRLPIPPVARLQLLKALGMLPFGRKASPLAGACTTAEEQPSRAGLGSRKRIPERALTIPTIRPLCVFAVSPEHTRARRPLGQAKGQGPQ